MIDSVFIWWRQRTTREQRLLWLLIVIAVPILLWFGVVRPIGIGWQAALDHRNAAARDLDDVRALADEIARESRADVRPSPGPLADVAKAASEAAGFTPLRVETQGVTVVLSYEAVKPPALFAWVAGLGKRGLVVERLNAHPNADRTLAASITLRRRR
ncbi:type II secretion system protein GspM [Sphingomonas montanisoli]|uniref:Type II secretion system protein M n=1 Tax=Sphingomonas montanisoli TaxID=2606412 RepID=A0A5D9CDE3_9SPHN|nr:type II secretion system protein GspM [Sphingomonas montanisoli]TZG29040.1 type II secretion system protein M [Sphingomonas montanisoli]